MDADNDACHRFERTNADLCLNDRGLFVVSLDFELYWGVRDVTAAESYSTILVGARKAVPAILDLFTTYGIHATWATVGFLFAEGTSRLTQLMPRILPTYENPILSPYNDLPPAGARETLESVYFAPSLIRLISATDCQEVASHTFSHYYCMEAGQNVESFKADLTAAHEAAHQLGVRLKSLVFPRNQCNPDYLQACAEAGIVAYRGNPSAWLYSPVPQHRQRGFRRLGRLIDAYLPICRRTSQPLPLSTRTLPVNIAASRFLRPYSSVLQTLESLRLRRITAEMTRAARNRRLYHLWWHPHNFGINLERNLSFLTRILDHYERLRDSYGMISMNMSEAAESFLRPSPVSKQASLPSREARI